MRVVLLSMILGIGAASPAFAQSESRVGIGAAVAFFTPSNGTLEGSARLVPLVRVRRDGWAPALGFHGFEAGPAEGGPGGGNLTVRPIMAGASYTVTRGRVATSLALVGGYAFNALGRGSGPPDPPGTTVSVANSAVWTPRVDVALDLSRRLGLVGTAGYVVTRPTVTTRTGAVEERSRWRADSVVLQIGLVVGLF